MDKLFTDGWNSLCFSVILSAEGDINDVLIKTLAEAHANTNHKLEIVHDMFRKSQVSVLAKNVEDSFADSIYFTND